MRRAYSRHPAHQNLPKSNEVNAIEELIAWSKRHSKLEDSHFLELLNHLVTKLEQLPIHEGTAPRFTQGFVLVGGEWYACAILNVLRKGWVEFSHVEKDGTRTEGIQRPFRWAHCSVEYKPCIVVEDMLRDMFTPEQEAVNEQGNHP